MLLVQDIWKNKKSIVPQFTRPFRPPPSFFTHPLIFSANVVLRQCTGASEEMVNHAGLTPEQMETKAHK